MKKIVLCAAASLALLVGAGCSHPAYYPPPPPPPPPGPSPLYQMAQQNGFRTGEADGARDVLNGLPYHARHTRAFHDAPGYDLQFGPFGAYRDAFREAYLRGYNHGYRRG